MSQKPPWWGNNEKKIERHQIIELIHVLNSKIFLQAVVPGIGSWLCSHLRADEWDLSGESPASIAQMPAGHSRIQTQSGSLENPEVTFRERCLTFLGSCDFSDTLDVNKDFKKNAGSNSLGCRFVVFHIALPSGGFSRTAGPFCGTFSLAVFTGIAKQQGFELSFLSLRKGCHPVLPPGITRGRVRQEKWLPLPGFLLLNSQCGKWLTGSR